VGHSLSPRIHNAALRAQGLDFVYLAFDVAPGCLTAAVGGILALGARGFNVTVPHKQQILHLLDGLDPLAAQVGAVNTVVNDRGRLIGYNTDVEGFSRALHSVLPAGARGRRCLVAGAGGAARAVVAALVGEGAEQVWVYNRTSVRAEELCAVAAAWGGGACAPVGEEMLARIGESADIVINATTVGLDPAVKEAPFPVDIVNSHQAVIDLVYGTAPTSFLRQARARGAATVDGVEMLLMQAASSYRLWTGVDAPLRVMRQALSQSGR
jgi:shikimate dehydrogenase